MDENAWRTARPDLITQAAIQRAAERVVKDSWRDWFPDVHGVVRSDVRHAGRLVPAVEARGASRLSIELLPL